MNNNNGIINKKYEDFLEEVSYYFMYLEDKEELELYYLTNEEGLSPTEIEKVCEVLFGQLNTFIRRSMKTTTELTPMVVPVYNGLIDEIDALIIIKTRDLSGVTLNDGLDIKNLNSHLSKKAFLINAYLKGMTHGEPPESIKLRIYKELTGNKHRLLSYLEANFDVLKLQLARTYDGKKEEEEEE